MTLLERKYQALDAFKNRLLKSEAKDKIVKLVLHGSLLKGQAQKDSDIDLLVVAFNPTKELQNFCSDLSFDVLLEYQQRIEAFVFSYFDYKYPTSLFVYDAKNNGQEIYSMNREKIAMKEAKSLVGLAKSYLLRAKKIYQDRDFRIAVDVAYNACELCAKALLVLRLERIPKTHSGTISKFGEIFVKEGTISPDLGRLLHKGLESRNKARYIPDVVINEEDAKTVIKLAEDLIQICEAERL